MFQLAELARSAPPELPPVEEIGKDYDLFWRAFSQITLSRVLEREFEGSAERLEQWAKKGWVEKEIEVFSSLVQFGLIPGEKYVVGIFPQVIFQKEEDDFVQKPGFTIKIWPHLERERQQGDPGTHADILADLSLVKLERWIWIGGDVWIGDVWDGAEVIMEQPLSVHFENGQITKTDIRSYLSEKEKTKLLKGVDEGPLSKIWFPRTQSQEGMEA